MEQVIKQVSTSFVQDQKHETKTERFVAIQPSQIETKLADHGFSLVHLKSGRARHESRADHQTTIARYRGSELTIGGLHMDLVFKVPHLYGAIQAFLGTYRLVCSNGLVVGTKFFDAPRIRHTGDALTQVETLIPQLVAKHDQLIDAIREMQGRDVTPSQVADFVREVAHLRIGQPDNGPILNEERRIVSIQYNDLMQVRRGADQGQDAFTVLNVVQENIMRHGMRYQTKSLDDKGRDVVRNMTARPVTRSRQGETESVRSVDLNASIWDLAKEILVAA